MVAKKAGELNHKTGGKRIALTPQAVSFNRSLACFDPESPVKILGFETEACLDGMPCNENLLAKGGSDEPP
jgi:hypothetical protein